MSRKRRLVALVGLGVLGLMVALTVDSAFRGEGAWGVEAAAPPQGGVAPGSSEALAPALEVQGDAFPQELEGTWLIQMNDAYRAKVKEAYDARRKPGTPSFERAMAKTEAQPTSWTFEAGKVVASRGGEREERAFRVKQATGSSALIELSAVGAQPVEMELRQVGQDELQLRFPQAVGVAPIALVRQQR